MHTRTERIGQKRNEDLYVVDLFMIVSNLIYTHKGFIGTQVSFQPFPFMYVYKFADLFVMQRPLEQSEERGKTEAVHVVDLTQITDDKVQLTAVLRQWDVGVPLLIQGGLEPHRFLQGLHDGYAGGLGLVQRVQELLILKDVTSGIG